MEWYAVEAHEGKDNDACLRLGAAGLRVWRPFLVRPVARRDGAGLRLRRGKVPLAKRSASSQIITPPFGRYFFVQCRLTKALLVEIERTPSVRRMLRPAGEEMPTPVPRAQIDYLRALAQT